MTNPNEAQLQVKTGFEETPVVLNIDDIRPLRPVPPNIKNTLKYRQIACSIGEVGVVEPPVVARDLSEVGKYLLLDGHVRIEALKDIGHTQVKCLISLDDEGYTYNKRINRLATIQEHRMIIRAVEHGVPEARIAKVLNIEVNTLRHKINLLNGICPEAAEILKDRLVAFTAFSILRRMVPFRQIEVAKLMVAMNRYSATYARALLAATPQSQLREPDKPKAVKGLTDEQAKLMERESLNLDREFQLAEQSYGTDHLDLVLAKGYLAKLLGNVRIVRYLTQKHQDLLSEFQRIAELETLSA